MQLSLTLILLTLSAIASCSIGYGRDLGNFMFIMTDNNACGDLACYGHPTIKTSNIDAGLGIYKETREEKRSKETQKERDVRSTDEAN